MISGIALCLLAAGCSEQEAKVTSQPPRPVLSILVEPPTTKVFGPFTGTIQPRYQSSNGFQILGRIVTRNANVGDLVKEGQLLASLDPKLSLLQLRSSHAEVLNARATLVNAQATEGRKTKLLADRSGGTTQAQVDDAIANRETAQAALDQALANLRKAKEQVGYTQLRAEYDGVISSWDAEVGQVVSAGQTVVTVARPEIREAVFDVPAELIDQIQKDAALTVSLLMDDAVSTSGKIREITPLADASTRTQRVRLTLEHPPMAFRLGTTVTVTQSHRTEPVIKIPAAAMLRDGDREQVWIVTKSGTVELRGIVIGRQEGDVVEVSKGLAPGDRVVTAGIHSLKAGQQVRQSKEASI
ncbi:MAG: efflux RND transporter periplasmic adaptor subunit [Rhodomicrobium sp.]